MAVFQRDFRRFQFPGFGETGTCFLRGRVNPDGTYIFLCSQLKNYTSTPVTSVVEEIFAKAVREFKKAGLVNRELSFSQIVACSRWVEHYPKGTGRSSDDTYALVSFASGANPAWDYVSLEQAIKECGVEESFFFISPEDLRFDQ
ncbi:hypothetical protein PspS35_04180 [Pseudomonas sp. S35]|uniref:hypothetical protein n=1 Tax=Pseudomonas sp. S35 TaxID=1573719 RepID=UPI00132E9D96|nr:hypothetical protein [Pseudomonas sp. S35]QHF43022.1 hypothetical protein PspS35_04180 [Pseudomonas sp. S35]